FSATTARDSDPLNPLGTIKPQQQAVIMFRVSPKLGKNSAVNIELRPAVGAALPFTKSAPASISDTQVLY
ncbi:MAG: hypothetical protein WCO97_09215, partial [bacterium]